MLARGLWSLIAAVPAGAAALIAATSILLAVAGGQEVWISSPLPWHGAWHILIAAVMLAALRPPAARLPRRIALLASAVFLLIAVDDILGYYLLLSGESIRSTLPFPLSIPVAFVLLWGLLRLRSGAVVSHRRQAGFPRLAGVLTGSLAMLLALLITFGSTDYRRRADCAIVLGAAVWDDGTASLALADRVNEGIRLWREGLVDRLVMTGGTGRNGWSEPRVMKRMAIAAGVPAGAVFIDEDGLDTFRSAEGCRRVMDREGLSTALLVSHYYHLARCRMVFALAGIDCHTVPARMSRRLAREPWFVLRECAGFIAYLLPRRA